MMHSCNSWNETFQFSYSSFSYVHIYYTCLLQVMQTTAATAPLYTLTYVHTYVPHVNALWISTTFNTTIYHLYLFTVYSESMSLIIDCAAFIVSTDCSLSTIPVPLVLMMCPLVKVLCHIVLHTPALFEVLRPTGDDALAVLPTHHAVRCHGHAWSLACHVIVTWLQVPHSTSFNHTQTCTTNELYTHLHM